MFLKVQLTIFQHWFRSWLRAIQATSHYLNEWLLVYWCIYALLGLNELINTKVSFIRPYVIQIKICAEYRDMLPRPRLVCQEPGLRPIGRSPSVPDKSSRGLGSMSRYSAQILICFIAYIFSIINFSVGLVGNLAELPPCTVPPATVIRMRLLSAHQTIKSPSMPCWGAAGRNTLWHSCHRTGEISR